MVIRGKLVGNGSTVNVHVSDGKIDRVEDGPATSGALGGDDVWVTSGICDVQVNGVGGISYKAEDLTVEQAIETTEWMYRRGTARWCPTVTTSSAEDAVNGLKLLADACEQSENAEDSFSKLVRIWPMGLTGMNFSDTRMRPEGASASSPLHPNGMEPSSSSKRRRRPAS